MNAPADGASGDDDGCDDCAPVPSNASSRAAVVALDEEVLTPGRVELLLIAAPTADDLEAIAPYDGDPILLARVERFWFTVRARARPHTPAAAHACDPAAHAPAPLRRVPNNTLTALRAPRPRRRALRARRGAAPIWIHAC